jgi:hypothetical protein
MSELKFSWPYIQWLTKEDRESYESDLPDDLENLEYSPIIPSINYRFRNTKTYEEIMEENPEDFEGI